jgi:5-methylcytosine-specific restriction protein A
MALQTRKPLTLKCGCGIKGYPSQPAAERALLKVQGLRLRDTMPKRAVQCWQGQWHLQGTKRVDTGPDKNTRELALERDDYRCASCNKPIIGEQYSLQHRDARGMGGTSDPAANSPANLITLCGSATSPGGCHLRAESRDQEMHDRGFWLNSHEDPATFPVDHATHGWVLLCEDGTVDPIRPLGGAA